MVEPYPPEKYDFVSWEFELPNIWKNNSHVPNHQPDGDISAESLDWSKGDFTGKPGKNPWGKPWFPGKICP